MSSAKDTPAKVSPLAGKPAPAAMLVDVPRLVTAYYTEAPDFSAQGHPLTRRERMFVTR